MNKFLISPNIYVTDPVELAWHYDQIQSIKQPYLNLIKQIKSESKRSVVMRQDGCVEVILDENSQRIIDVYTYEMEQQVKRAYPYLNKQHVD